MANKAVLPSLGVVRWKSDFKIKILGIEFLQTPAYQYGKSIQQEKQARI